MTTILDEIKRADDKIAVIDRSLDEHYRPHSVERQYLRELQSELRWAVRLAEAVQHMNNTASFPEGTSGLLFVTWDAWEELRRTLSEGSEATDDS